MTRISIRSELLQWAYTRAGLAFEDAALKFPKLPEWLNGTTQPTLKQAEKFAQTMHVPFGYLFLPTPPVENVPIPDYRTLTGQTVTKPSPNLLDTIYNCQERQTWYREYMRIQREQPLDFVGSVTIEQAPLEVAALIRDRLGFTTAARAQCPAWEDTFRFIVKAAEEAGILVMVNGIVLNNTHRPLDVHEFRGFAFADNLAPLIFINGRDAKSAQLFTLAHELAHIWLGATGLSNASAHPVAGSASREEIWCNKVAAEFLVPRDTLTELLNGGETLDVMIQSLKRCFKVSGLVILRRLLDIGYLDVQSFDTAWAMEMGRLHALTQNKASGGGDFYNTNRARVSTPFVQALVASTMEGITLYRDAFRMLGVSKTSTFENMGRSVGMPI
jgi:Zn-dependent peptidase ImmA (M78 family)